LAARQAQAATAGLRAAAAAVVEAGRLAAQVVTARLAVL